MYDYSNILSYLLALVSNLVFRNQWTGKNAHQLFLKYHLVYVQVYRKSYPSDTRAMFSPI